MFQIARNTTLDGEGPAWHKLFRHVRDHEADVLEFEHSSAQHLMTLLGNFGGGRAQEDKTENAPTQGERAKKIPTG